MHCRKIKQIPRRRLIQITSSFLQIENVCNIEQDHTLSYELRDPGELEIHTAADNQNVDLITYFINEMKGK